MRSNKQLLDEVFETLIILHITKTESYNCFIIHFKCRKPLTKFNKTSAEAFTPPAEKKIGTKWALCTTAQAGNIKSGYLRILLYIAVVLCLVIGQLHVLDKCVHHAIYR